MLLQPIRKDAAISSVTYHCIHGPQDQSANNQLVQEKAPGKRFKRTLAGLGKRRGCTVCFAVRRLAKRPDVAEIRYFRTQHANHGPPEGEDQILHPPAAASLAAATAAAVAAALPAAADAAPDPCMHAPAAAAAAAMAASFGLGVSSSSMPAPYHAVLPPAATSAPYQSAQQQQQLPLMSMQDAAAAAAAPPPPHIAHVPPARPQVSVSGCYRQSISKPGRHAHKQAFLLPD